MILYHVSLEPVKEFTPRVPKGRAAREDDQIPRICVSDSIQRCLSAMPGGCSTLMMLQDMGIVPTLYVYEFHVRKNAKGLIRPEGLRDLVPDAEATHEHWLTRITKQPKEYVCRVTELTSKELSDPNGMPLYPIQSLSFELIPDTEDVPDNAAQVADTIPNMRREFYIQVKKCGLGTVLQVWWEARRLMDLKQTLADSNKTGGADKCAAD